MRKSPLASFAIMVGSLLGVAIWALYMGYIPFGGAMLGLAMVCGAAIALTWAKR